MSEIIGALIGAESGDACADGSAQARDRSLGSLAQKCFQLAESHLDRIEVRRIWRQITQRRTRRFDRLPDTGNLVNWKVVHRNDVFALERWNKTLLDIGQECLAVHGS